MNETLTALIEVADKERNGNTFDSGDAVKTYMAAREAIPALRASLARDAALEQYIGELRQRAAQSKAKGKATKPTALLECASRLEQIMKGEK